MSEPDPLEESMLEEKMLPHHPGGVKVLLAEDHELTRFGVRFALEQYSQLQLVGEAVNGVAVLAQLAELQPDVVLMDIGMPEMDGVEATQKLKQAYPQMKVIMLTSKDDASSVRAALSAGADAYCMKDIKTDRLVQVIEMVLDGVMWLDPAIARLAIQGESASLGPLAVRSDKNKEIRQNSQQPNLARLNKAEQTLLNCVSAHCSVDEIADTTGIEASQVSAAMMAMLSKLLDNTVDVEAAHATDEDPAEEDVPHRRRAPFGASQQISLRRPATAQPD